MVDPAVAATPQRSYPNWLPRTLVRGLDHMETRRPHLGAIGIAEGIVHYIVALVLLTLVLIRRLAGMVE